MPSGCTTRLYTIGRKNDKLGPETAYWNMPSKLTCPGSSRVCRRCCYDNDGQSQQFVHRRCHLRNLIFSKTAAFVPEISAAIQREAPPVFRPNDIGDYSSLQNILDWTQICRNCPETRFFCFTRTWRVRRWWPALRALAAEANMNMGLSVDRDCAAELSTLPGANRLMKAWLAENDDDRPTCEADLIFRNGWRTLPPLLDLNCFGGMVCPHQTGYKLDPWVETCFKCGYCWLWKELRYATAQRRTFRPCCPAANGTMVLRARVRPA